MPKARTSKLEGWRHIAKEIAIVFVGVLIALYAQQVVDSWQWRAKVRTAEAAMQRELFFDNGPQVYHRAVLHPCLQQRLTAVHDAIQSDRSRAEVARLIGGVRIYSLSYDNLAIQSAFASDVAAHMPQDRLNSYIQAYQMIPTMDRIAAQEADDLARLKALPRTGGPLTQDEKGRLLESVESLRSRDLMMYVAARWAMPALKELGGSFDRDRMLLFRNFGRYYYGNCIKDLPADWAPKSPFHPDNFRPGQPVAEE